jgi:glycosyltransferase involved in cell wall biosynthesis
LTISVVIPAWNAARHLGEALESALCQSVPPDQVIVVDDGSTDDTGAIARSFAPRVSCIRQPNTGIAGARNTGIGVARGRFIALLDADDRWRPDKLARQRAILDGRPDVAAAFCLLDEFVSQASDDQPPGRIVPRLGAPAMLASGMLVRAEVFGSVGLFSPECGVGEFIDWFARFQDAGCTHELIECVLLERRLHSSNMGVVRRAEYQREYLRVLKRALDRRRERA